MFIFGIVLVKKSIYHVTKGIYKMRCLAALGCF